MSEALSSSEIEDVLSSIRRLVSDDLRPANPRGATPAADADKLLLTPALRVVQTTARSSEDPPALDEVMASVSAKVDAQGEEWESETGDLSVPVAETMAESDWALPEDEGFAEADFAEAAFVEAEPEDVVLAFVSHRHETAPAEDAVAETVEAAVAVEEVLHAPAQSQAEAPLPGWAQSSDHEDDDIPAEEPMAMGTVEPDQAWADEAEAEVLQELGAAPAAAKPVDEFEMNSDVDLPFNEEVLREIVRDVLREELQGRLGERITRNIRKLVRAEIARVMATDEFM